jgi:chromosome segregation ATPase
MTTTTSTTAITTVPLTTKSGSCDKMPTYEELRQQNLKEIATYFDTLYGEYNKFSPSITRDVTAMNKYEAQLDTLSEQMVNKLQENLTATIEQHNIYTAKLKEIEENRANLKLLKQTVKDESVTRKARESTYDDTLKSRENKELWHRGYLIGNIVLLLLNILGIVYAFVLA